MALSGTWNFSEEWTVSGETKDDQFTATFNSDGTVTIEQSLGFALVWYTGSESGSSGIILAGDNSFAGILAAYYGTMGSDNQSMSGTANGKMTIPFKGTVPVTGKWSAVRTS